MSYQGISRTYRPQTFSSVVGQEAIVTTLKNAIRLKKTAQAYLFCGTRGTGKTTLARILAKALNCKNLSLETCEPCDQCSSCQDVAQGKSLNVLEIDGASNRGIEDIRQLNENAIYAPSHAGCKVFLIDEAHMLTKEAFNALLKTLEEPPPNVKFFLATTEAHKIPPTILSRCQRFDLQRISSSLIAQKLMHILQNGSIPYEEEALHLIASLSDGSMRVAESLLDQLLCFSQEPLTTKLVATSLSVLPIETFFRFDEAFKTYDLSFAFSWAHEIFSSGKDLPHLLDCFLEHYRNILACQLKFPLEALSPSFQEKYQNSAMIYTQEQALYILDYLIQWHQQISKTPFKRVSLEMLLLHILRSKHRVSAADLICKLQDMQQSISLGPLQSSLPPPSEKTSLESKDPVQAPSPQEAILPLVSCVTQGEKAQQLKEAPEEPKLSPPKRTLVKQENLMRFAAVELEGVLVKQ